MEPLISTLFFPLQAAAPATKECFQLRHFVAPLLSILSPEMERSTLSASRGAQGASRGLVVRPRAVRRFCANVDSSSSSSTLRSSSSLVGPRRWNQQPRILLVRAAPSTPSGSAGDESDVLKLHEELLAQVRNLKNYFRNRVFLAPTERICLATKDEKTSTTSFFLLSFSYLPSLCPLLETQNLPKRSSSARAFNASSWKPSTRHPEGAAAATCATSWGGRSPSPSPLRCRKRALRSGRLRLRRRPALAPRPLPWRCQQRGRKHQQQQHQLQRERQRAPPLLLLLPLVPPRLPPLPPHPVPQLRRPRRPRRCRRPSPTASR